jgi:hypothetical protein
MGKWRTLTYPTSDTDDPINTKICMVDYVGDMMKPYQNGVDRIQGGGLNRCATYNKMFPAFFSVFIAIDQRTAQTAGAILMVNGSKDVVWRKEVPFGGQNIIVQTPSLLRPIFFKTSFRIPTYNKVHDLVYCSSSCKTIFFCTARMHDSLCAQCRIINPSRRVCDSLV